MRPLLYSNKKAWLEHRGYRLYEFWTLLVFAILCWLALIATPIAWYLGYKIVETNTGMWVLSAVCLILAILFTYFSTDRYNDIAANKQVYERPCSDCSPEKTEKCDGNC